MSSRKGKSHPPIDPVHQQTLFVFYFDQSFNTHKDQMHTNIFDCFPKKNFANNQTVLQWDVDDVWWSNKSTTDRHIINSHFGNAGNTIDATVTRQTNRRGSNYDSELIECTNIESGFAFGWANMRTWVRRVLTEKKESNRVFANVVRFNLFLVSFSDANQAMLLINSFTGRSNVGVW